MFDALLESAAQIIVRHAPHHGVFPTLVPGLTLYRIESNAFIERTAGEIMTTFIVRGRKTTAIGGKMLEYGAGESLVCGIASPSEFHTLDASRDHPFLALSVSLDASILMEYADALSDRHHSGEFSEMPGGVFVIRLDEDLRDVFLRLLKILDRPKLIAVCAPLILRELHALLLDSSCGAELRALASAGSEGYAVLKTVSWIRCNYATDCSVEELARKTNMSNATFHRKFRQVNGFSPVQFRKRVRLFEARRLLVARETNVTSAAFVVGYESLAQFVRDYKELFGLPPLRDIKQLHNASDD